MSETSRITEIAERETELFRANQARQFIICATNLAAHDMPMAAVAKFLRDLADQIAEFS
jgi:hypothetical protein